MKKAISLVLLMTLVVFLLTACGEKAEQTDTPVPANAIAEDAKSAAVNELSDGSGSSGPVTAKWFDDAVFVGDSITLKLSYYAESNPDALSNAQFFCAGSLGYASSLWDLDDAQAVHPYYQGETVQAEYCAEKTGAKKVLIMLGMNDLAVYGVDGTVDYANQLIDAIFSHTPDVTIYLQSVTPILYGHEIGDLNNETIRNFDEALQSYCKDNGYKYLDIYHVVCDDDGYLAEENCGDPGAQGIHFTDAGCQKWIDYLKENVNA